MWNAQGICMWEVLKGSEVMQMSGCCGGGAPEKKEHREHGAHEHGSGSACGMGTGSGTSWLIWAGVGVILAVVIFYMLR